MLTDFLKGAFIEAKEAVIQLFNSKDAVSPHGTSPTGSWKLHITQTPDMKPILPQAIGQ